MIKALIGLSETKLQKMQALQNKTLWQRFVSPNKTAKSALLNDAIQHKADALNQSPEMTEERKK